MERILKGKVITLIYAHNREILYVVTSKLMSLTHLIKFRNFLPPTVYRQCHINSISLCVCSCRASKLSAHTKVATSASVPPSAFLQNKKNPAWPGA